ncbi:MAG: hypothetical protein PQJ61_04705 [Spirochaetales bacterium]|uniref:Uncharacterized protein n=1 Tax=Candidatus Thalassospirochaeta sargassi TaxID=3119039 RepID=A0AAJ1IB58_9SPIO|nr:hypothetical protein [Spirochaetales bacterium]
MNIHKTIDRLSVKMGNLYGENLRFFRDGIESEPLREITRKLEIDFVPPTTEGEYHYSVSYKSWKGTARCTLLNWAGKNKPCLIFHHGSGETNYSDRIMKILSKPICSQINLIAVSIPCNRTMKKYLNGIAKLERFCALLGSSVRVFESINNWLLNMNTGKVVASGISLGGWVTTLHFSLYNSMDEYRPIFAGAALDHLFTDSVYGSLCSAAARENPSILNEVLNFEGDFNARDAGSVFPLLSRYDQYIDFDRQKKIYSEKNLNIIEKGHVTGSMDMKALREHLLDGLGMLYKTRSR